MDIGSTWNGWKVEEFLGEGAFGKVYRIAREEFGFSYESALKVIRIPENSGEVTAARLDGMSEKSITEYFHSMVEDIAAELALMSQLRGNSNIVSFEDHKVVKLQEAIGWEIYIRMELLTPLFEYVNTHELSERDVIRMGIDLCHALEICQKYRIIHRDIKPENIFLSTQGHFKLGDFGIARQLDKTSSGLSKKGSPSYMAPEVYKGEAYNATVDIYSLGLVLYRFMNNSRLPFFPPYPEQIYYSDKEAANQRRISGEELPPPCNADDRLAGIILKASAYNPSDRYQSAYELRRDLQSLLPTEEQDDTVSPLNLVGGIQEPAIENHGEQTRYMFGQESELSDKESLEQTQDDIESEQESVLEVLTEDDPLPEAEKEPEEELTECELGTEPEEELTVCEPKTESEETIEEPLETQDPPEPKTDMDSHSAQNISEVPATESKSNRKLKIGVVLLVLVIALCAGVYTYKYYHHIVPRVTGMTEKEAKDTLKKAGLKYQAKKEREFSDDGKYDQGEIQSQSRKQGEQVKKGTKVLVVISKGKRISSPNLTGKKVEKATKEAEALGLVLKVESENKWKWDYKIKKGSVLSQNPKAGTDCEKGEQISVILSKGPEQVKVPDVEGKSKKNAKKSLAKVGLGMKKSYAYSDSVKKGHVIYQTVKPGKLVDKKSKVGVTISRGAEPVAVSSSNNTQRNYSSNSGSTNTNSGGGKKKKKKNNGFDGLGV